MVASRNDFEVGEDDTDASHGEKDAKKYEPTEDVFDSDDEPPTEVKPKAETPPSSPKPPPRAAEPKARPAAAQPAAAAAMWRAALRPWNNGP